MNGAFYGLYLMTEEVRIFSGRREEMLPHQATEQALAEPNDGDGGAQRSRKAA